MSIDAIPLAAASTEWTVFWVQLPLLVLAAAVIIVATTALRRARPEDVPRVFEAFATAFGRRTEDPPSDHEPHKGQHMSKPAETEDEEQAQ